MKILISLLILVVIFTNCNSQPDVITEISATSESFSNFDSTEKAQWRGTNRDGKYPDTGLLKKWNENVPKML